MSHQRRRVPRFERLESRMPCAGDVYDPLEDNWHNESDRHDVNGDGYRGPIDVLVVANLIDRFGAEEIANLRPRWLAEQQDLSTGGFHPDVNQDGFVTPFDVLEIVNRFTKPSNHLKSDILGKVAVFPDRSGRPLRVTYSSPDGRLKDVDLSQEEVTVNWTGEDLLVVNKTGMPMVVAKPSAGLLEVAYSGTEGVATVTKFESDGKEIVESYVCVPGWNADWLDIPEFFIDTETIVKIEPDEVRRPIPEFTEVLGAIVLRRIAYRDGSIILHEYEEASAEKLISVTATLSTGESMKMNLRETADQPIDLSVIEAALLNLLKLGFQPTTSG